MKTFKGAFKSALIEAGYKPQKVNEILTVWKAKHGDGPRLATPNAVVAAVKRDG